MSVPPDFVAMIRRLREVAGLSDWKIAQAIGYEHGKEIRAIELGRMPPHDKGELLISLDRLLCVPKDICPTGHVSCETVVDEGAQSQRDP